MYHGGSDICETESKLPQLDVQASLIVTGEVLRVSIWIESARTHERVTSHSLVAAENAGIVLRHYQGLAKIVETQQRIPAVIEYPSRRLCIPPWKNPSRNRRNAIVRRKAVEDPLETMGSGEQRRLGGVGELAESGDR